jgi:D-serine deaminase-like pyridoxal phosphate-dependent protein
MRLRFLAMRGLLLSGMIALMHVSEIETPAIVVDLDVMERNLQRVADYAHSHGLRLRPHTKTHKSPLVGRMQLDSGASGLTVAKVGEAEVMVRSGTPDLLVAYPVLGATKLRRLMDVAQQTSVTVALDNYEAAKELSTAAQQAGCPVKVLVEGDVGLGRTGLADIHAMVSLAKAVVSLPGLTLAGFNFYPGHIKSMDETGMAAMKALDGHLNSAVDAWRLAGLPLEIVSGGSTPTLFHSHLLQAMTEIRPGTYVFNDRNTVEGGGCTLEDCAAHILVTVVSTNRSAGLIVDGGSKTFSSDRLVTGGHTTFGLLRETPDALFLKMNEEHGYIDLPTNTPQFRVGDRLRILPNHICVAVNLHERVYGLRGEEVEKVWDVEARGKLQ